MLTSFMYRDGHRISRIEQTDRWRINGGGDYGWNEAIVVCDEHHKEPPPQRITCQECGDFDLLTWMEPTRKRIIEHALCFDCLFWVDAVQAHARYPNRFVAGGNAYTIGKDEPGAPRWALGFGGATWRVVWLEGRTTVTSNLWCQGLVPERFRVRLPDTAVLVELSRAAALLESTEPRP